MILRARTCADEDFGASVGVNSSLSSSCLVGGCYFSRFHVFLECVTCINCYHCNMKIVDYLLQRCTQSIFWFHYSFRVVSCIVLMQLFIDVIFLRLNQIYLPN